MGVVEDGEPPLKRMRGHLEQSNHCAENSSVVQPIPCSLGEPMARPFSQGDGDTIGSKGVIKKSEFIKIITRTLYSLGYKRSGALLEEESGIPLYSSMVNLLMQQVMDGKWDNSVATLHMIGLQDETLVKSASFLLLEQKFIELLKTEKVRAALDTLRNEIVPLNICMDRVHELATFVISPLQIIRLGPSDPDWHKEISRSKILERLQNLLPSSVMIPEKRLEHLVEKALDVQCSACVFHNTVDSDLSLYCDHQCGKHQIPSRTLQVLQAHTDEVWCLQFSHNGKYLASSSKDQSAVIWEVKESGQLSMKHMLAGHQKPIISVSWNPSDSQLLTCGEEEVIKRWDVSSGECLHVYEKSGVGLISCGWFLDSGGIFAGMADRSICLWDLDGGELECWKGHKPLKITDMAITDDGKKIISICRETAILLLDRETKFETLIEEENLITSFSLSKDNKFLLVNLADQEIHLWSIEGHPNVVSKYKGHKRTRFVIRSCLGGFKQAFLASGSEDSQVYIWHRYSGKLLLALPGHSGAINCVSWNPANPHMLASGSDDRTIRIWGLDQLDSKHSDQKNGVIHLYNGRS